MNRRSTVRTAGRFGCHCCRRGPVVETAKNGNPTLTIRLRSRSKTGFSVPSGFNHDGASSGSAPHTGKAKRATIAATKTARCI